MNTWTEIWTAIKPLLAVVGGFILLIFLGLFIGDVFNISDTVIILIIAGLALLGISLASLKTFL